MQNETRPTPKAPRWITSEAGRLAWEQDDVWRSRALSALSVGERSKLLAEAEQRRGSGVAV